MANARIGLQKFLIICMTLLVVTGFATVRVHANATDTLTFKVGYYGWPTSDYIEKKVFNVSDIKGASSGDLLAYTYYDGTGHRIAIDSAHGAKLDTLLNKAGIDKGSISSIAFYTTDSGGGAFATFTMQELILTDRYFFPNLAEFIGRDGKYIDSDAKRQLWNDAERVDVALAYEDKWVWYQAETEGAEPTSTGMNTQNRFRLCFGQSNPLDYRTYQSAKMVECIYITLSGSPKLTTDETNIDGKIGSSHKVYISAVGVDDAMEEQMMSNLTFSSSNESVVTVDSEGNLKFVGEGDAVITATSEGTSVEINVSVGDGKGSGSGKGDSGNGDGEVNGKSKVKSESKKVEKVKDDETYMYVLSKDAASQLKNALAKQAPAEQASMNTYQEAMDEDAEQLEIEEDDRNLVGAMALVNGIIAIEGGIFGFLRYRKQRWG